MIARFFLSRAAYPAVVSSCELLDISLRGEPLYFAWFMRGKILVAHRFFLARDYQEVDWQGGEYGAGWITLDLSPHAAANLIMHLRDMGWVADEMPDSLYEAWVRGKIYNTDLIEREGTCTK